MTAGSAFESIVLRSLDEPRCMSTISPGTRLRSTRCTAPPVLWRESPIHPPVSPCPPPPPPWGGNPPPPPRVDRPAHCRVPQPVDEPYRRPVARSVGEAEQR